jgi:hypothetical protein
MTDLDALLDELAAPVRALPAPPFAAVERAGLRRQRRRRIAAGLAGAAVVASGAVIYLVSGSSDRSSQLATGAEPFIPAHPTGASVCVAGSPTSCTTWPKPRLDAFLEALSVSPPMTQQATVACKRPGPYRNADITLRYAVGLTEVLNVNTGCGFVRNNRSGRYLSATDAVTTAVFGRGERTHFVVAYERGVNPDTPARREALRRCAALPGASATGQEPNDRLTRGIDVAGGPEQQRQIFACLDALPNVQITEAQVLARNP